MRAHRPSISSATCARRHSSYVGERDIECPAPQTQEFWHALKTLGVPTSVMIYPGEGHGLRDPDHIADWLARTLKWFDEYLK